MPPQPFKSYLTKFYKDNIIFCKFKWLQFEKYFYKIRHKKKT
jgi:hypothetical protein